MTQPLPPNQFDHIIRLISPYMAHQNRRIYITPWCAGHPNLYGRIDWTGPDRTFAVHVVELFHTYGLVDLDKRALDYFLEAVREDMGLTDQAEIDNILAATQQEAELFLKSSASNPLPPPSLRAPHFTGRDTLLEKLKIELQLGKMVALCGPGGIGKASLAVEAVYKLRDEGQLNGRFPDGVLFHSFYDEQATELALDNLLRQLGEQPQPPVEQQAEGIFMQRQLLLILDGAEDATDLSAVVNLQGHCGVLITSRQRRDARGCHRLDVEPFEDGDAVDLLHQLVDAGSCGAETAQAICQRIGNLPLAVLLAGRDMAENGLSGQLFLQWLQATSLEVLDQGSRRQESVPLLLERSLTAVSEPAKQALALIGQLALAPVDHTLLAPALEQESLQMTRILGELVNLSLLRPADGERYSVAHALIHTYASERLQPDRECLIRLDRSMITVRS